MRRAAHQIRRLGTRALYSGGFATVKTYFVLQRFTLLKKAMLA
jgi:hypothetical protein